jgi:3-hydroxy-9,10-secoandrosta-1,3,5(10)-triene-9,17-dione monooxygenase reductase component
MESYMSEWDGRTFRNTMSQFGTGVVIATGSLRGEPAGFAAQSFVSLSLDPPLIGLCPGKNSASWPKIRESGRFCINVLASDQKSVCDIMAKTGIDKFANLAWSVGQTGSPILEGVIAYIDCELDTEHDAGDHTVAIGRVVDLAVCAPEKAPLLFFQGRYGSFTPLA